MSKELKNLNLDCLNEEQRKIYDKVTNSQVKIMQVGEGNFLMSFFDWMVYQAIKAGKYDGQRVLILVKEPETLIQLMEGGVEIPKVDLGIIFNENGREAVTKFIALNEKEKEDLETIKKMGVPVVIQYIPTDAEEEYK